MPPIHGMKVQRPRENWYDWLALVPRDQLGDIASDSEIGDRQLAGNLQSFLQEHHEITLGKMEIIPPRSYAPNDRSLVLGRHDEYEAVELPNSPMPENVRNFEEITLTYVDEPILDFLQKFQENSLLANVNLDLHLFGYVGIRHVLPMLDDILPLISSIYSVNIDHLFDWIYGKDNNKSQPLLETMVAQTKILSIEWFVYNQTKCTFEDKMDWCCSWLYTPRDDGMPRTLISEYTLDETSSFIDRIKKDFLDSNKSVSFFIRLTVPENLQQPEISLDNKETNEKLVIKAGAEKSEDRDKLLMISRYSPKTAKHKIEEDKKEILEWHNYRGPKRICLTQEWNE